MLQTLREKQKYQVTKKIKLSRLLVQCINEIKYRQETTQNVLTVLHNTLHYLRYCLTSRVFFELVFHSDCMQ